MNFTDFTSFITSLITSTDLWRSDVCVKTSLKVGKKRKHKSVQQNRLFSASTPNTTERNEVTGVYIDTETVLAPLDEESPVVPGNCVLLSSASTAPELEAKRKNLISIIIIRNYVRALRSTAGTQLVIMWITCLRANECKGRAARCKKRSSRSRGINADGVPSLEPSRPQTSLPRRGKRSART